MLVNNVSIGKMTGMGKGPSYSVNSMGMGGGGIKLISVQCSPILENMCPSGSYGWDQQILNYWTEKVDCSFRELHVPSQIYRLN